MQSELDGKTTDSKSLFVGRNTSNMQLPLKPSTQKTKEEEKNENSFSTHERFLTLGQIEEFKTLLDKDVSETSMQTFLEANPEIFTSLLHNYRTGHHSAIVIPKQEIRPRLKLTDDNGLIPDFIIGGKSSDGWNWWIIELKGPSQTIFSQSTSETYFNSEMNKGICQLLNYIDFCSEQQSNLRDSFGLQGFREPNGLILAGREKEFTDDNGKRKLKASWNRLLMGKLELRTYDSIRRNLDNIYANYNKSK